MLYIKQAPTTAERLGQNIRNFPQTESVLTIPLKEGVVQHGLKGKEIAKVEKAYGYKFDSVEGRAFYGALSFRFKHSVEPIGDLEDPKQLLKVRFLQQMGALTSSGDDPFSLQGSKDFVLVNEDSEIDNQATLYEKRDECIARLLKAKKDKKYLLELAMYLLPQTMSKNTVNKAYVKLREFIEGELLRSKNEAVDSFINATDMDRDLLSVTTIVMNAVRQNIIRVDSSNKYYNVISNTRYGKNQAEVVKFLLEPSNQLEIGTGGVDDTPYSLKNQLKSK